MDHQEFIARFEDWQTMPGEGDPVYFRNIWKDIGSILLDKKLTILAEMYLLSDPEQRKLIVDHYYGKDTQLLELVFFIRRIATLITTKDDDIYLQYGLAIAAIEGGRWDYRDLIVSLVILRFAAERVGIDTAPYFNKVISAIPETLESIFCNARDHSQDDMLYTIKHFGPTGWDL